MFTSLEVGVGAPNYQGINRVKSGTYCDAHG
jgi:hypothetical protein